jgi:hypothetical protein
VPSSDPFFAYSTALTILQNGMAMLIVDDLRFAVFRFTVRLEFLFAVPAGTG